MVYSLLADHWFTKHGALSSIPTHTRTGEKEKVEKRRRITEMQVAKRRGKEELAG